MRGLRIIILTVAACLALYSYAYAEVHVDRTFKDWEVNIYIDDMTGKKTYFATTYSQNILHGWLSKGKLMLGYQDEQLYIVADDLGFETDDSEFSGSQYIAKQYVREKVDDGDVCTITFQIWNKNHDGMTAGYGSSEVLIKKMITGNILFLEVKLFGTKGRRQIAKFSLLGFTKAMQRVNQLKKIKIKETETITIK